MIYSGVCCSNIYDWFCHPLQIVLLLSKILKNLAAEILKNQSEIRSEPNCRETGDPAPDYPAYRISGTSLGQEFWAFSGI